jgi:hypothetical protein
MQISQKNGFTSRKLSTNIFKNIIWHLFAGESHQVVKITVPYCTMHKQKQSEHVDAFSEAEWNYL